MGLNCLANVKVATVSRYIKPSGMAPVTEKRKRAGSRWALSSQRLKIRKSSSSVQIRSVTSRKPVYKRRVSTIQQRNRLEDTSDIWEDVSLDFEEPTVNLMNLPLEIREQIWRYVLDDLFLNHESSNHVQVDHPLLHYIHEEDNGQFMLQQDSDKLRRTFFASILPKQIFLTKQILDEASLVFLRHSNFALYSGDAVASMQMYLTSFPQQCGYQNMRYVTFGRLGLQHSTRSITSPLSLLKRCPGIRNISIVLDFHDLQDKDMDPIRVLLSPYQFDQKAELSKLCTLPGPMIVTLRYMRVVGDPFQDRSTRDLFAPYAAAFQQEIDRTGSKITLKWETSEL